MRMKQGLATTKEVSLGDEMHDVIHDCLTDRDCPQWEDWQEWLDSKEGRAFVDNIASNAVDVATSHMEDGLERMKA